MLSFLFVSGLFRIRTGDLIRIIVWRTLDNWLARNVISESSLFSQLMLENPYTWGWDYLLIVPSWELLMPWFCLLRIVRIVFLYEKVILSSLFMQHFTRPLIPSDKSWLLAMTWWRESCLCILTFLAYSCGISGSVLLKDVHIGIPSSGG